jgi:hypothetical protein
VIVPVNRQVTLGKLPLLQVLCVSLASLNRRSENVVVHPVIIVAERRSEPVMRPPTNTLLSQKTGVRTGYYQPASALLSLTNTILSPYLRSPHTPLCVRRGAGSLARAVPATAPAMNSLRLSAALARRSLRFNPSTQRRHAEPCQPKHNNPGSRPLTNHNDPAERCATGGIGR